MAFFRCSRCHCKEDTALCNYWSARLKQQPAVCSACDPKIAKWHGQFAQESAEDWNCDERGLLTWSKRDVEDWLGQPIEVIGAKQGRSVRFRPARSDAPLARGITTEKIARALSSPTSQS